MNGPDDAAAAAAGARTGAADSRFDPDTVTGWTLVRAYHVMARRFNAAFAEVDLTATHFGVLMQLSRDPVTSQAALARGSFMTPQAMGEVLATLESAGLISRDAPVTGRPTAVNLSDAGRAALHRALPRIAAINEPAALGLTVEEAATLNGLLHKLRRAVAT